MHPLRLSRSSNVWVAESCTLIRALPLGTWEARSDSVDTLGQKAISHLNCLCLIINHNRDDGSLLLPNRSLPLPSSAGNRLHCAWLFFLVRISCFSKSNTLIVPPQIAGAKVLENKRTCPLAVGRSERCRPVIHHHSLHHMPSKGGGNQIYLFPSNTTQFNKFPVL